MTHHISHRGECQGSSPGRQSEIKLDAGKESQIVVILTRIDLGLVFVSHPRGHGQVQIVENPHRPVYGRAGPIITEIGYDRQDGRPGVKGLAPCDLPVET